MQQGSPKLEYARAGQGCRGLDARGHPNAVDLLRRRGRVVHVKGRPCLKHPARQHAGKLLPAAGARVGYVRVDKMPPDPPFLDLEERVVDFDLPALAADPLHYGKWHAV